jgi:ribonuclease P protein component
MSDEAHLSAKPPCAQAAARLPQPQRNAGRPQGFGGPPGAGSQAAERVKLGLLSRPRLQQRRDFLAANHGKRAPMPGFVLLVRPRDDADPAMRYGITVTKKIGGAVIRNRMKRRFRALADALLPVHGIAGADHVLIGRQGGIERDFALLRAELVKALGKLGR